jgi:hypothetical protein
VSGIVNRRGREEQSKEDVEKKGNKALCGSARIQQCGLIKIPTRLIAIRSARIQQCGFIKIPTRLIAITISHDALRVYGRNGIPKVWTVGDKFLGRIIVRSKIILDRQPFGTIVERDR